MRGRCDFLRSALWSSDGVAAHSMCSNEQREGKTASGTGSVQPRKIPVALDTDVGTDIDDTWALVMMLRSLELDPRLVTTVSGDPIYRARLAAKLLEIAGRTDIPIGIGISRSDAPSYQADWVGDYSLSDYPGTVYEDGVRALVDIIMASAEPVTVVAIGPLSNIDAALRLEPRIAERARFVGMQGSIRCGWNGSETVVAEYNVSCDPAAARAVFGAPWEVTITPLDTCGIVRLRGRITRECLHAKTPW